MIGLIAAMPMERDAVVGRMDNARHETAGSVEFTIGTLAGQPAVIALSGVGKVSAAIASTLLCARYNPDLLISIGVAGGLLESQNVGDMVFSDQAIQADFDTSTIDGPQGIGKVFAADEALAASLMETAASLDVPAVSGAVATQDLFMADPKDYERLMRLFPQSVCSEMEGGAIAQTASAFGVPFVVIRSLSDVVVKEDNPMQFEEFASMASDKAAALLEAWCKTLFGKSEAKA